MSDMKYLQKRGDQWHYVRRVPKKFSELDKRGTIRKSLGTDSLRKARQLRNDQIKEDNLFWKLQTARSSGDNFEEQEMIYQKAKLIAKHNHVPLIDMQSLLKLPIDDILKRLEILESTSGNVVDKNTADALLGTVKPPSMPISKAFELYCDKLAIGDLVGKSDGQKKAWRKAKLRPVKNFIAMHGDIAMDKLNREHAREFYNWWAERLLPEGDKKPLAPNSANRDLGNLRKLYREYWEYMGEEGRSNPFRNMRFTDVAYKSSPPFENDWVRTQIMAPGMLEGLNDQAKAIIYTMIETGCRPSELANLLPKNIKLTHEVPHICVSTESNRQLKSRASEREIPLVGISLKAMQDMPNGFPRYKDREALLSASLMKAFRVRKLFPTSEHKVYSLRHSFEKRMQEAGLDYALRCTLMGHANNRPKYGDGGSLQYRRDELLKIVHPFENNVFKRV